MKQIIILNTDKLKESRRPFRNINISQIEYNQIKFSIRKSGMMTPIHVRPTESGIYEIIKGHYRFKAAKELGIGCIACVVHEVTREEAEKLYLTLCITQVKLRPRDIIRRINIIQKNKEDFDIEGLSTEIGVSVRTMRRFIKIAEIEEESILALIDAGKICLTNAANLARVKGSIRFDFLSSARTMGVDEFKNSIDTFLRTNKFNGKLLTNSQFVDSYQGKIVRKSTPFCKKEIKTLTHFSKYGYLDSEAVRQGYVLGLQVALGIDPFSVDLLMTGKTQRKRDLL